jgi:hypothetical protein
MISLTANYISEEEAQKILEPYLLTLTNCMKVAWQQWERLNEFDNSRIRYPLTARTRACFIYDHICHEIKHQFEGVSGVSIDDSRGFLLLNIQNLLLMRFKKLNRFNQASNIATYQQETYSLQMELPDIPDSAARITVGYLLDKIHQAELRDLRVVFPVGSRGKNILWSFSILGTKVEAIQPEIEFEEPAKPRVKAKGIVQETRKTGEK